MSVLRISENLASLHHAPPARASPHTLFPLSTLDRPLIALHHQRAPINPTMASSRPRRRPAAPQNDSASRTAQSITSSLLNTKSMMEQELSRVSSLSSTIQEDGDLLKDAKSEHVGMGGTMKGAKGTLNKLKRQDLRDAFVLKVAVIFYWTVVAYVLWSRIKVPFLP